MNGSKTRVLINHWSKTRILINHWTNFLDPRPAFWSTTEQNSWIQDQSSDQPVNKTPGSKTRVDQPLNNIPGSKLELINHWTTFLDPRLEFWSTTEQNSWIQDQSSDQLLKKIPGSKTRVLINHWTKFLDPRPGLIKHWTKFPDPRPEFWSINHWTKFLDPKTRVLINHWTKFMDPFWSTTEQSSWIQIPEFWPTTEQNSWIQDQSSDQPLNKIPGSKTRVLTNHWTKCLDPRPEFWSTTEQNSWI